ncbi:acetone carboxylase subunit gamma [Baekduia soli]|uniref:acetone carboxylase subunit gamma n=1 Tax=Baekduia soli TaxID=496014 RepID=UPI001651D65B|nr:acetone carboxylase subunit gamma [Baekduia soli]
MSQVAVQDGPGRRTGGDPTVGDAFTFRRDATAGWQIHCSECDHHYGPAERDPKLGAVVREGSITDLSTLSDVGMTERLVARQFFCPSCALLMAVNVQQVGDPVMLEWSLDPATLDSAIAPEA